MVLSVRRGFLHVQCIFQSIDQGKVLLHACKHVFLVMYMISLIMIRVFETRALGLRIRLSFWGMKLLLTSQLHTYFIPTRDYSIGGHVDFTQPQGLLPGVIVPVFIELAGIHTFITTVKFSTQCTTSGPLLWMKTNVTSKNWWVKILFNCRITVEVSRENLSGNRIINIVVLWKSFISSSSLAT